MRGGGGWPARGPGLFLTPTRRMDGLATPPRARTLFSQPSPPNDSFLWWFPTIILVLSVSPFGIETALSTIPGGGWRARCPFCRDVSNTDPLTTPSSSDRFVHSPNRADRFQELPSLRSRARARIQFRWWNLESWKRVRHLHPHAFVHPTPLDPPPTWPTSWASWNRLTRWKHPHTSKSSCMITRSHYM